MTRVQPSGKEQSWRFNPYWVQLKLEPRVGRSSELSLDLAWCETELRKFLE